MNNIWSVKLLLLLYLIDYKVILNIIFNGNLIVES